MSIRRICVLALLCLLFLAACGCTAATPAPLPQPETAVMDEPGTVLQEDRFQMKAQGQSAPNDRQTVQTVDGVQVVSGRVLRLGNGMEYTPAAASGFFSINGKLAENSEIAISINPVSVLRYKLSLRADAEKTVKAEIRAYKQGELLVAYTQENLKLQAGDNDVDACIDTGEGVPCRGSYAVRFYLDDSLISETIYNV